jgi:hypothetical protein
MEEGQGAGKIRTDKRSQDKPGRQQDTSYYVNPALIHGKEGSFHFNLLLSSKCLKSIGMRRVFSRKAKLWMRRNAKREVIKAGLLNVLKWGDGRPAGLTGDENNHVIGFSQTWMRKG